MVEEAAEITIGITGSRGPFNSATVVVARADRQPLTTIGDRSLQAVEQVTVIDRIRAEHAKRPVAVYGPAQATRAAIFSDDWLRSR